MKLWTSPWVSCLVILLLCFGSECGTVRRKGRSKRELVRIREAKATIPGACATRLPRGKRSLPGLERRLLRQRRRSAQAEENSVDRGKSVYFTGRGDQLRLKPGVEIPRGNFTLEMWIKPEGGQRSPTVIAGRIVYTSSLQLSTQLLFSATPEQVWFRKGELNIQMCNILSVSCRTSNKATCSFSELKMSSSARLDNDVMLWKV